MQRTNEHGQPIGDPLPEGWTPPPAPARTVMEGMRVRVEPLDAERHGRQLHDANRHDKTGAGWTYMTNGPYPDFAPFRDWLAESAKGDDPLYFVYVDRATNLAIGYGSYMRIDPAVGCIEVGGIRLSPLLQRRPLSTEAMHLMMKHAFALGYRRYEWKCDALNEPSRRAAERLGFTFEGIFRKATHYKGRSRDTAWYSIIEDEWPTLEAAHRAWLDPGNFDARGGQKQSLSAFVAAHRNP